MTLAKDILNFFSYSTIKVVLQNLFINPEKSNTKWRWSREKSETGCAGSWSNEHE
jgi:hypothetical protein